MRISHTFVISLSLLFNTNAFASERSSCAHHVPNSRNFIVSGALFHRTIRCLENLIEHQQSTENTSAKPENQSEAQLKNHPQLEKEIISSVSVQFSNTLDKKKVITVSFMEHSRKKIFELILD